MADQRTSHTTNITSHKQHPNKLIRADRRADRPYTVFIFVVPPRSAPKDARKLQKTPKVAKSRQSRHVAHALKPRINSLPCPSPLFFRPRVRPQLCLPPFLPPAFPPEFSLFPPTPPIFPPTSRPKQMQMQMQTLEKEKELELDKELEQEKSIPAEPSQPSEPSQPLSTAEPSQPSEPSEPSKHPLAEEDQHNQDNAKKQKTDDQPQTPLTPAPKPPSEPDLNNLPADPLPPHQKKYALNSIKAIRRLKDAAPFLHPVDIVKLNIPFYYNYIQRPMDLSTMEKKLNANAYATPQDLAADFALMVSNCEKFNGKDSAISQMARNIHASFEKHMLNMPPREIKQSSNNNNVRSTVSGKSMSSNGVPKIRRDLSIGRPKREIHPPKPKDLPYDTRPRKKKYLAELRFCQQVLKELMSKKYESISWPFMEPVDPVAMECPNYFDIVKEPMDLSTIQNKLSNGDYEKANDFEHDIRLVFNNCFLFNPPTNAIHGMGKRLEAVFNEKWSTRTILDDDDEDDEDDDGLDDNNDLDDEFNVDINSITDPTIEFLLANIKRMTQDLQKMRQEKYDAMKKEWLKKKSKRVGKKKGKKRIENGSNGNNNNNLDESIYPQHVSYEMKKEISEAMQNINDKQLKNVITIIKEGVPGLQDDDEIELEMDALDNTTLLKLYKYLIGNKGKVKKNNDVEEVRIAALKEKLKQFDKSSDEEEDDDDDDDESDVSSEED